MTTRATLSQVLVDLFGCLDQLFQANEPFSSRFDTACQPDEMQTDAHNVVGAAVAGDDRSRLALPYGLLLSVAGEVIKGRFEGALIDLPTRMGLFNCLQSSCRRNASVALLEFPDRRRQIEAVVLFRHALIPRWWWEMEIAPGSVPCTLHQNQRYRD